MKHHKVSATWKLQNLTLWKEVNKTIKHGKHFQMICQRVNNMIQPRQNFQFILGDDLEGRFQTSFYSEYPWIEYSVKEDALTASGEKEGLNFSIVKRIQKLSTKYNGPRKTVFFCSDKIGRAH